VLSLGVTAAIMLTGTLILDGREQPTLAIAGLADLLWRNVTVAALLGALGVGVGALLRNQVATVVGLLVVGLALEPPSSPRWRRSGASARSSARRWASSAATARCRLPGSPPWCPSPGQRPPLGSPRRFSAAAT
jgi:hypothetical protein